MYWKCDTKREQIQNQWLCKADKDAQLRVSMIAVCSGVVFWEVEDVTLNPLCQYPTIRVGKKISTAIPCIFISVHCRGSGACMCQLLGSISAPRRNHFDIEEALSTRKAERVMAFCDFSGLTVGLATVMCCHCCSQPKKLNTKVEGEIKSACLCYILVAVLCFEPLKKIGEYCSGLVWSFFVLFCFLWCLYCFVCCCLLLCVCFGFLSFSKFCWGSLYSYRKNWLLCEELLKHEAVTAWPQLLFQTCLCQHTSCSYCCIVNYGCGVQHACMNMAWERRFLLGHEPFALVSFFFFLSCFSLWREKVDHLLHSRYNVEAFLPLGDPKDLVCSHKETWFDLKNEQFIVASVRLVDCCGFLIYWISVRVFFWLCLVNKELLEI